MDSFRIIIPSSRARVNGQMMAEAEFEKLNGKDSVPRRFLWKFSQQEP